MIESIILDSLVRLIMTNDLNGSTMQNDLECALRMHWYLLT
nr:MAG TPA: hypothetical protein [Caudoviricetes sp.]